MEKYIWRLLTAMFWLLAALVLGMLAFLGQGSVALVAIGFYGFLICALIGIARGLFVIIDYHRDHKDEA